MYRKGLTLKLLSRLAFPLSTVIKETHMPRISDGVVACGSYFYSIRYGLENGINVKENRHNAMVNVIAPDTLYTDVVYSEHDYSMREETIESESNSYSHYVNTNILKNKSKMQKSLKTISRTAKPVDLKRISTVYGAWWNRGWE